MILGWFHRVCFIKKYIKKYMRKDIKNAKINAVAVTWAIKFVKLVKKYWLKCTGF
jgi:hypothetical protein